MTTTVEAFIAVFYFLWAVPEAHPMHDDPYGPPETSVTVEITGFMSRDSCEDYIAAAADDPALVPITGAELVDASCRRGL